MYLILILTILFTRISCERNPIILYLCCMVTRRSSYLTWSFDCCESLTLQFDRMGKVRHSFVGPPTLAGELVWRQHSRPRLHCRLTLRSPSGTLGMGVATRLTMRVVVITPLKVTPSLASEPEPLPLPSTLTGTLLWRCTLVMGLTRLSAR
jgi:hypothetical protein